MTCNYESPYRQTHGESFLRCAYCGSMHPDEFMRRVEAGAVVTPTDKNYKAYVDEAPGEVGRGYEKFYYEHLKEDQKVRFIELYNEVLNEEEIEEHGQRIKILRRKMALAFPYRFYNPPYFMRIAP